MILEAFAAASLVCIDPGHGTLARVGAQREPITQPLIVDAASNCPPPAAAIPLMVTADCVSSPRSGPAGVRISPLMAIRVAGDAVVMATPPAEKPRRSR